ncbi:MAG TPA: CarD family transcriptional regulator [Bryobacteraceae bacterium]|nr:CarD family transcriptional regulator [Bryobacteraceae bacterium]
MTHFTIGEKIVYPNHGIGVVENISSRAFGAQFERFYLLRLNYNSMTVMVPLSHAGDVGLRRVTKCGDLSRMLAFLSAGQCKSKVDWKDRYKENCDKMRNGSLLEVAEVLKGLLIIQTVKPLSFREKKMLDRSRHMLISEYSTCRGISEDESKQVLDRALAKASLSLPEPL